MPKALCILFGWSLRIYVLCEHVIVQAVVIQSRGREGRAQERHAPLAVEARFRMLSLVGHELARKKSTRYL
jgi:hypothetical protein